MTWNRGTHGVNPGESLGIPDPQADPRARHTMDQLPWVYPELLEKQLLPGAGKWDVQEALAQHPPPSLHKGSLESTRGEPGQQEQCLAARGEQRMPHTVGMKVSLGAQRIPQEQERLSPRGRRSPAALARPFLPLLQ